jgi:xanthine dehydrogenase YagS FAD-binding subunit
MRPFTYRRVSNLSDANASAADADAAVPPPSASVQFLAGGTNILDLMKLDVMRPDTLIDINDLAPEYSYIRLEGERLRLGAFAHMSAVAEHSTVIHECPALAQSLQLAASAQLRNMATLAGNVLQRTRCNYFRDVSYQECNKRIPGSGCAAMQGVNRKLAVLGVSEHCIAHYPGDFAVALTALDADVMVRSRQGVRTFPVEQLHRLPADTPHIETLLTGQDVIVEFSIPVRSWFRRSLFLKIRDRESYEFALASAAIALDLHQGIVRDARIVIGGLATKPWRAHEAESALRGHPLDPGTAEAAAQQAFSSAITHGGNDFKPQLGQRTLVRALLECAAQEF